LVGIRCCTCTCKGFKVLVLVLKYFEMYLTPSLPQWETIFQILTFSPGDNIDRCIKCMDLICIDVTNPNMAVLLGDFRIICMDDQ